MASRKQKPAQSSAHKRLTAAEILNRAQQRASIELPSAKALAQLDELMQGNDAAPTRRHRVRAEEAMELLAHYGWACGRAKFDRLIRRVYGRGWEK